jgi:hypothetical protein
MFIKILIGLVILIVLLVIIIATRPSTFHVQRAITIAAPAENVFARINDFRNWGAWSPWEKKDPDMKRTFGDQTAGVGGTYAWAGDKNVGEGRMTIERSERPSLVQIKLEFFKPFAGTNTATIALAPSPAGTTVTWSMDGRYNFASKAFSMVMDMDKMIGNDFEAGLAAIKAQAEAEAKTSPGAETGTASAR